MMINDTKTSAQIKFRRLFTEALLAPLELRGFETRYADEVGFSNFAIRTQPDSPIKAHLR
jgi:hypothetical protein